MKFHYWINKYHRSLIVCGVLGLLSVLGVAGIISCGKLSDDTNRPTSPIGTSGSSPLPIAPQSSWGTYALSISANPNTIPADGVNYTTIGAKLTDSSGRSVENFVVKFQTTSSDTIALFVTPGGTTGTSSLSPTITGLTHSGGTISVRMCGIQSGSAVVQASIDLDTDGAEDLFVTTVVMLTAAAPTSSAGTYSLALTANPTTISADGISYSTITATVTDSAGASVENLPVLFTANLGTVTPAQGTTDRNGKVIIRFTGGLISGNAFIQAQVAIPDLGTLQKVVQVTLTPGGPPSTAGNYTLTLKARPDSIPADKGTCSMATVTLTNSANARLVENIKIKLEDITKLGSFVGSTTSGQITTYEGVTDRYGTMATCFYGYLPGVALIQASATVSDFSLPLQTTDRVTISEVTIPSPIFEFTLASPTVPCWYSTVNTARLDVIVRVKDSTGLPIGGITLAYWFLRADDCSGVEFTGGYSGTAATDLSGRAVLSTTLTATGTGTCSYSVEITYDDKSYVSPTEGIIKSCGATPPLTLSANPATLPAAGGTSTITACGYASGLTITLSLSGLGGTLSPGTVTTDSTNCGTATYTNTGVVGTATINGTATGYTSGSTSVTVGP